MMPPRRADGRALDEARPLTFERDFTEMAAGSVLVSFGRTRVLCTASVDTDMPRWLKGRGRGWVSAEYSMLPGSTPERATREAAKGKQSGRTQEIQRLDRSFAAQRHAPRAAAGRADSRGLRRAPSRRWNAHRLDLWRLRRSARRHHATRHGRSRSPSTRSATSWRRCRWASWAASRCWTCPTKKTCAPTPT